MKREDKNGKNKEAWGVTRQGGNSQEMEYLGRDKQEKEWEVGGLSGNWCWRQGGGKKWSNRK